MTDQTVNSHHKRRNGRIVTTAGVARTDGRYFLGKRKPGGALSNRWEFPGGKCRREETDHQALMREFDEELGVTIQVGALLGEIAFEHDGKPYVLVAYHVDLGPEEPELREHTQLGWFAADDLFDLDLADSDRTLLERMRATGDL